MTQNTNSGKPEWFELIDGNAPSAQVQKVNKFLPAMAVVVAGAIIASGALLANASEEPTNQVVTAASQASTSDQVGTITTENSTPGVTNPANPASTPGMLPPSGGDDDDHEDDVHHDDDRHDHDDHDDRRSHHGDHDDEEDDD